MIKEFRVFYDGKPASQGQLDEIEEIVVEQEVGRIWEARIRMPVYISEDGVSRGEDDASRKAFTRVRIEARIGNGSFIPLIDGTRVMQDDTRSPIPSRSSVTIVVHDDSTLLHRKVKPRNFAGKSDGEIVRTIFETSPVGGTTDIDSIPARPDKNAVINQHGTDMQMLRSIAFRYGDYYAYVLPGATAGTSVCCFKKLPVSADKSIPPLALFGETRNLAEFNIRENLLGVAEVKAASLNLSDKAIKTGSSIYRDASLLGDDPSPGANGDNLGARRLPPGAGALTDLDAAAAGWASRLGYMYNAEGSVLPRRYEGILQPYKAVLVQLSDSRYSGDYVIHRVVHTLNKSEYTQSFTMRRNAISDSKQNNDLAPPSNAKKSVPFNMQGPTF